jgi:hypothetical protein
MTGFSQIKSNQVKSSQNEKISPKTFNFHYWRSYLHLNAGLYKRSLFENPEYLFTKGLSFGEDTQFIIKLLHTVPFYYVSQCLFNYLIQEDSVTQKTMPLSVLMSHIDAFDESLAFLQQSSQAIPFEQCHNLTLTRDMRVLTILTMMQKKQYPKQEIKQFVSRYIHSTSTVFRFSKHIFVHFFRTLRLKNRKDRLSS